MSAAGPDHHLTSPNERGSERAKKVHKPSSVRHLTKVSQSDSDAPSVVRTKARGAAMGDISAVCCMRAEILRSAASPTQRADSAAATRGFSTESAASGLSLQPQANTHQGRGSGHSLQRSRASGSRLSSPLPEASHKPKLLQVK